MIDLHSHILHGLDDGARDLAESVEMARAAVADGIRVIAATPHVRDDYPTTAEQMRSRLAELRGALADARVELDVRPGGELALDALDALAPDEVHAFALAGSAGYLLLEFPYHGWPLALPDRVFRLRAGGTTPVLAHPERNAVVQEEPERLEQVVRAGALVQITAASLDGRLGRASRRASLRLLELRLAHLVASDAHSPGLRAIGLSEATAALGSPALAHWLSEAVPAAIVDGDPLPPRPRGDARPSRWRDRLLRARRRP